MNLEIKKIIAREGLIIISSIVIWLPLFFYQQKFSVVAYPDFVAQIRLFLYDLPIWVVAIAPYAVSLVPRFVIWAVKTLKFKESCD